MLDHPQHSTYKLERSFDKKHWTTAVTDSRFQQYSKDDIFDYDERVSTNKIYYYRLFIIDKEYNLLRRSEIIVFNTRPVNVGWKILQNPVMNELVLINKGEASRGTISILIYDEAGRVVIKFRAASIHTTIRIPVTKLRKGYYIVQLSILNKTVLNQKWFKQ